MALIKLNNQSLVAVTAAGIPIRSGSVLQVQSVTKKDTWSGTPGAGVFLDGTRREFTLRLKTHLDQVGGTRDGYPDGSRGQTRRHLQMQRHVALFVFRARLRQIPGNTMDE